MSFSEKVFIDKSLKGLTTFVIPTQIKDVVTISGSLKGGEYHAKSYNSKIASLSGSMLDKGTLNKTKHEISETLESLGAGVSIFKLMLWSCIFDSSSIINLLNLSGSTSPAATTLNEPSP